MLFSHRAMQAVNRGTRRAGRWYHHARGFAKKADRLVQRGAQLFDATRHLLPEDVQQKTARGLSTYNQVRQAAIQGDRVIQSLRP